MPKDPKNITSLHNVHKDCYHKVWDLCTGLPCFHAALRQTLCLLCCKTVPGLRAWQPLKMEKTLVVHECL